MESGKKSQVVVVGQPILAIGLSGIYQATMNRRHFLVAASAAASQSWASANDRVRLAIIGVGSRGSAHIREILPVANVEIAALVDPDGRRTETPASTIFQQTGN